MKVYDYTFNILYLGVGQKNKKKTNKTKKHREVGLVYQALRYNIKSDLKWTTKTKTNLEKQCQGRYGKVNFIVSIDWVNEFMYAGGGWMKGGVGVSKK